MKTALILFGMAILAVAQGIGGGSSVSLTNASLPYSVTSIGMASMHLPPVTVVGVTGSTSYTYAVAEIVVVDTSGVSRGGTNTNFGTTISNGNAVLSASNYNTVTQPIACRSMKDYLQFYRTASSGTPSSTGGIGPLIPCSSSLASINDTGLDASATDIPRGQNSTGVVYASTFDSACGETPLSGDRTNQCFGLYSVAFGTNDAVFGFNSAATGTGDTVFCEGCAAQGSQDTVLSRGGLATTNGVVLVGDALTATDNNNVIEIGSSFTSDPANSFQAGGKVTPASFVAFGYGLQDMVDAIAPSYTLQGTDSVSISNGVGGTLNFAGGDGTGSGGGGSIVFKTAAPGTAGSTPDTLATAMTITPAGIVQPVNPVKLPTYTVSTLPSGQSAGSTAVVTDASTFTVGNCVGGGSNYMLAVFNGTSWTCH